MPQSQLTPAKTRTTIALLTATLIGCGTPPDPEVERVQTVASYLVGVMDTTAQAKAVPEAPSVRMTTCKLMVGGQKPNQVFLYQEQALTEKLNQPYRQRVLKIAPGEGKMVRSISYKPENPSQWVGLCDKPESDRAIAVSDLEDVNCTVFLKPVADGYIGETQPGGCPTNYRGAVSITNTITLDEARMETQDRGFDAAGKQVWGADKTPYQFRRKMEGK